MGETERLEVIYNALVGDALRKQKELETIDLEIRNLQSKYASLVSGFEQKEEKHAEENNQMQQPEQETTEKSALKEKVKDQAKDIQKCIKKLLLMTLLRDVLSFCQKILFNKKLRNMLIEFLKECIMCEW